MPPKLTRAQLEARAEAHRANEARLQSCHRHAFKMIEDARLHARYFCPHCGGTVNCDQRRWYEMGLRHGKGVRNGRS